jgi:DNA-binding LytR/AlgR family response regulator
MTLNCVAIDDDNLALTLLKKYCGKIPSLNMTAAFSDPMDGLAHLRHNQPDILFLDIDMPGMSGISIAEKANEKSEIIFTTSYRDFAFEGFQLNAADYLLKPIEFDQFFQAVNKARDRITMDKIKQESFKNDDFIIIKADYKNVKIRLSQILFIEALDNYIKIHTAKKTYVTLQNLKGIGEILCPQNFLRIHKSYIVSLSRIDFFTKEHVHIKSHQIPIGRTFSKKALALITK